MNKPGLYLCIYSGKEYLVNIQGINPCLRITSVLDLTKFKNEAKFSGSKVLIKEIEDNLDKCMFKYVSFSTEIIIENEVSEIPVNTGNLNSYQLEKYKQRYLSNNLSETDLQVFIMKDTGASATIARSIAHDIKLQIKKG